MSNFREFGYNDFFERNSFPASSNISEIDSEIILEPIAGGSLPTTGIIKSQNGNISINLDTGEFIYNVGGEDKLKLTEEDVIINSNLFNLKKDSLSIKNEVGEELMSNDGLVGDKSFDSQKKGVAMSVAITSTSWVDLNNTSMTIKLDKKTNVLFFLSSNCEFNFTGGDSIATGQTSITVNNHVIGIATKRGEDKSGFNVGAHKSTHSNFTILELDKGTHNLKVQARMIDSSGAGTPTFYVTNVDIGYLALSN